MATQNQVVNLSGKKYQLVPVTKGTKAPTGVEKVTWNDGNEYFLIPMESEAPKTSENPKKNDAPKAEAKAEAKADVKSGTPSWLLPVIALVVIIALIWSIWANSNKATPVTATGSSVSAPASAPADNGTVVSNATVLDLGSIGAYHAVFDSDQNKWTLGIWETSTTRAGTGLSEFKLKATSVSFTMPADGEINNSAGHIAINNTEWTLGNPAKDSSGNTLVKKGDSVTIWTDGPNDSAGFQIWFK